MIKPLLACLLLASLAPAGIQQGKPAPASVATTGVCSPVVTNPQAEVTIKCETAGLSKADAEKQAKEYAEILNKIRASSLDMKRVLALLNDMKGDVADIKSATAPRHLTPDQKAAIFAELEKIPGERIWIAVNAADPEAPGYAGEFVALARQAKLKGVPATGDGFDPETYEPPLMGLQLAMNKSEALQKRFPKVCDALYDAFEAQHMKVSLVRDEAILPGVCQLFVGAK